MRITNFSCILWSSLTNSANLKLSSRPFALSLNSNSKWTIIILKLKGWAPVPWLWAAL